MAHHPSCAPPNSQRLRGHRPSTVCLSTLQGLLAVSARRFQRALDAPDTAQTARLHAIMRLVAGSRQGARIRGLVHVRTPREFQDAVPLSTYDTLVGDIDALKRGVPNVLTRERVLRFECSGGSSGASKYIPQTRQLLREFHRALAPWLCNLWRHRPATKRGPGYWSLSPLGQRQHATAGGIAVGSGNDTAYFPRALHGLLTHVLAVPGAVGLLPDIESCRYVTLRSLVACPHLALISVWNPSFLTLLMEVLDTHVERLLDDVAQGTCRPPTLSGLPAAAEMKRQEAIAHVVKRLVMPPAPARASRLRSELHASHSLEASSIWPHLCLLSMWTDAHAQRFIGPVAQRFPGIEIQGKGLLATEGVASIPWLDAPAPVLTVRSHFYEFCDPARPEARPRLAHELEVGQTYAVVISTGGGLLRYRLGDLVRVDGMVGRTPCLTFVGRADMVSDLVGEKLAASRAQTVLTASLARTLGSCPVRFVMLAPAWDRPPAYHLYVETPAPDTALIALASEIERLFCAGHPYHYARQLGQLRPVQVMRVENGAQRYEAHCVASGQRAGDVKPVELHMQTGWDMVFAGKFVASRGAA